MSDQSATGEGAPEATTTEGPPEWLGPIAERMEQQHELMGQMADAISGLYYDDDGLDDEGDEDDGYRGVEDDADDDDDLSPEQARRIIGSEVDQRVEARFAKEGAARALEERNALFEELKAEIPALQDDKYARELVQNAAQWLRDHNAESGIATPMIVDVIEQLHKVRQLDERAASEQPERDVVLESGSGATPDQKGDEVDWADRVLKAAARAHPTI